MTRALELLLCLEHKAVAITILLWRDETYFCARHAVQQKVSCVGGGMVRVGGAQQKKGSQTKASTGKCSGSGMIRLLSTTSDEVGGAFVEGTRQDILKLPYLVSGSRARVAVIELDPQFSAQEFVECGAVK
jgi:hypothetical protein